MKQREEKKASKHCQRQYFNVCPFGKDSCSTSKLYKFKLLGGSLVRAQDYRPRGPGFKFCGAILLWNFVNSGYPHFASVFRRGPLVPSIW